MDVSFSGILSHLEEQIGSTFMEQGVCIFIVALIFCIVDILLLLVLQHSDVTRDSYTLHLIDLCYHIYIHFNFYDQLAYIVIATAHLSLDIVDTFQH